MSQAPSPNAAAPEHVLILGATSGIARAVAERLAAGDARLLLAGRNTDELARLAADLKVRAGAEPLTERFDASAFDEHPAFVARCIERLDGRLDGVVLCHGAMTDQAEAERDIAQARRMIDVNYTSAVSILEPIAAHLAERGSGWIAAVSSVAGDRGRAKNYLYGSTKAALTAYLSGLRNRLHARGVHVLTIKPGFVATAMTAGILDPDSPTVASPRRVARDIERAIRRRRNVIYTPWFWRPILGVIRIIPEPIFKRMKVG